jgi:acetoin utilization protein AcuB
LQELGSKTAKEDAVIAQELMTENPVSVSEDTEVAEVVEIFQERGIRHIPVVRNSELVGMVSDRDIRSLFVPKLVDAEGLATIKSRYASPISSLMAIDVIKVHPDSDVSEVVDLMVENKVGAIPVVDSSTGDLLGIVSYIDVLRSTFESRE